MRIHRFALAGALLTGCQFNLPNAQITANTNVPVNVQVGAGGPQAGPLPYKTYAPVPTPTPGQLVYPVVAAPQSQVTQQQPAPINMVNNGTIINGNVTGSAIVNGNGNQVGVTNPVTPAPLTPAPVIELNGTARYQKFEGSGGIGSLGPLNLPKGIVTIRVTFLIKGSGFSGRYPFILDIKGAGEGNIFRRSESFQQAFNYVVVNAGTYYLDLTDANGDWIIEVNPGPENPLPSLTKAAPASTPQPAPTANIYAAGTQELYEFRGEGPKSGVGPFRLYPGRVPMGIGILPSSTGGGARVLLRYPDGHVSDGSIMFVNNLVKGQLNGGATDLSVKSCQYCESGNFEPGVYYFDVVQADGAWVLNVGRHESTTPLTTP